MSQQSAQKRFELVVVQGSKAGARAELLAHEVTTVGTGFDNDIVLGNSADAAPQRIEIRIVDDQFRITIIEGALSIGGVSSDTTASFFVPPATGITLADTVFELQLLSADAGTVAALPGTGNAARSRFATLAVSAVLGLGLVIAGVIAYPGHQSGSSVGVPEQPGLSELISPDEYPDVVVETADDGSAVLRGRVATRAKQIALKALLGKMSSAVSMDVAIDEILIEDVAAIYRLNGIEAEIELSGPGALRVSTAVADLDFLKEVEARVQQDVTGLVSLHRRNTPPPVVSGKDDPDFTSLPGKRIKMVVTTEPAFILTEDGSRYFTGAILPSGYKIKSIFEKTVKLERDNEIVDLVF